MHSGSDCDKLVAWRNTISLLPFAVLIILSQIIETFAIFSAFGICLVMVVAVYYRSTHRPEYPPWYWLDIALLLSLLGCGIAHMAMQIPILVLQCIPATTMFCAIAISMIVKDPFVLDYALPTVTAETAATPEFLISCQILSGYWAIVMLITAVCQWTGLLFVDSLETGEMSNPVAFIILGIVVPLCLPMFLAPCGCNLLAKYLKTKSAVSSDV
eukprot:jgi/Psemu1/291223/fgenesh1_pg.651_\